MLLYHTLRDETKKNSVFVLAECISADSILPVEELCIVLCLHIAKEKCSNASNHLKMT